MEENQNKKNIYFIARSVWMADGNADAVSLLQTREFTIFRAKFDAIWISDDKPLTNKKSKQT